MSALMLSSLMLKIPRIDCKLQQTYIKKVGNAHRKLLAYPSSVCIQTTQNGKVDFKQFPDSIKIHMHSIAQNHANVNSYLKNFSVL